MHGAVLVAACLAVGGSPAGGSGDRADGGWIVRETSLGPVGERLAVSPDRKHVARVVRRGNRELVLRDRDEGAAYDAVAGWPPLLFSPDSGRLGYLARREGVWRIVVDGAETTTIKDALIVFSLDGSRWLAWEYHEASTFSAGAPWQRLRLEGEPEDAPSEERWRPGFGFCASRDARRLAFACGLCDHALLVRGPAGEESRIAGNVRRDAKFLYECPFPGGTRAILAAAEAGCEFSPDGRHVVHARAAKAVHAVDRLFGRDTACQLMLDGDPVADAEEFKWPAFSPDGSRLAYPVKRKGQWYVTTPDGREEGPYDDVGSGWDELGRMRQVFFSPDGRRLGYQARVGRRWSVVVDGIAGQSYDDVGRPVFSPDSRRVAHRARRQGKWVVVVDGRPGTAHDKIEESAPSGAAPPIGTPAPLPRSAPVFREDLAFSPDGQRVLYRAKGGAKWFVVVDERAGAAYDELGPPAVSPDGRHVAHAAKRGGTWVLVVDGVEGGPCDVLTDRRMLFDGPQRLHTVIQRGREYFLLEVTIPDGGTR